MCLHLLFTFLCKYLTNLEEIIKKGMKNIQSISTSIGCCHTVAQTCFPLSKNLSKKCDIPDCF